MIAVDVGLALIAVVTVCCAMVIGMAFLPHPTRATATWTAAFVVALIASYAWVAGDQLDAAVVRAASSTAMLSVLPMLWSGFRIHRGRAPRLWCTPLFAVTAGALLVSTAGSDLYPPLFRGVFVVSAGFVALLGRELLLLLRTARDIIVPLGLACGAYLIVAVLVLLDGLLRGGQTAGDQLALIRDVNTIGNLVFAQCAALTIILLTRSRLRAMPVGDVRGFDSTAASRLERAQLQGNSAWSLLDIRLDDPEDVRAVSNAQTFSAVAERFITEVHAAFPPEADLERVDQTRILVFTPGTDASIRARVRTLLTRVATFRGFDSAPMRLSASIGWAPVTDVGFDPAELRRAADDAAVAARRAGGDRWVRAEGPRS
jgi:GGDEF domain-containing protein